MTETPNPGSPAAIALGCACPRMDNGHGRGWGVDPDGTPTFIVSDRCDMHWNECIWGEEVPQ